MVIVPCFNSSKVRYDQTMLRQAMARVLRFNSSKVRYDPAMMPTKPSSKAVSIPQRYDTTERARYFTTEETVSIPQRYDTTIPIQRNCRSRRRFNSSKVRYDGVIHEKYFRLYYSFNSSKVRYDVHALRNNEGRS